ELALATVGLASPNPQVGCVLVRDGAVVGEGAHRYDNRDHAEIVALKQAGERARGATAYVTLEPCSHHGRTGPCADALVAAGVARVVIGIEDPDPNVAGAGIARLQAAGVEVVTGVNASEIERDLAAYLVHRRLGRPCVTLKLALTLDGRAVSDDPNTQWITGPEARADGHRLRATHDAILVGAGTVRSDDPRLTTRDAAGPDPKRVVLGHAPPGAAVHPCVEMSGS